MTPKSATARDVAVVVGIGVVGVILAVQGWRSWSVDNDLVEYIDAAHALLSRGQIPDHGVVTSFGSYAPPGLAWFGVPGAALFADPRLLDVPGNALLHLGTLCGIFLLARAVFGNRCALLAVLLYGISERGLLFAGSLGSAFPGPRAHPFFYVWITYWAHRWVAFADARYLAAALLTWVAGMYVFMELAPAILILPAVWAVYRPPLRLPPLALAGALALVIWYPYLRFESTRGFADIRSQMLMQQLAPTDYVETLCVPTQRVHLWQGPFAESAAPGAQHQNPQTGFMMRAGRRILAVADGLVINFHSVVPGAGLVLFALTLGGLLILSDIGAEFPARWLTPLAIGLLAGSAVANEIVVRHVLDSSVWLRTDVISTIRTGQAMAALAGIALLMRRPLARFLHRLAAQVRPVPRDPQVVAIALVVPWLILLFIAEWGRQDRLMGLWPLQVIVLAFACIVVLERAREANRFAHWAGILLIAGVVLANPLVLSRIVDWRHEGWSGVESAETEVGDYVSGLIRSDGRDSAAIGYRVFEDTPPAPPWKFIDERWRYGGEFDVLIEYRNGISNLNRCGESLSAIDDYRIVAQPESPAYSYYFDVAPAGRLRFLKQVGPYQVFKRD